MRNPIRSGLVLTAVALVAAMAALAPAPAAAQIVHQPPNNLSGAGGQITFRSGFPPFNGPFGVQTTGVQNIPLGPAFLGGGLFLQRWHLSPFGYAEGGTGVQILVSPDGFSYAILVPLNSYLIQRRFEPCGPTSPQASLHISFDIVFKTGIFGFPRHRTIVTYPIVGRNTLGPWSMSAFQAGLFFGTRQLSHQQPIYFFNHQPVQIGRVFRGPGQAFAVQPIASAWVPAVQPFWQFLVWGDVKFITRGCPLTAPPLTGAIVLYGSAPGEDGEIGTQSTGELPPYDPNVTGGAIEDPEIVLDNGDPFPPIPSEGPEEEILEMAGDNHRPQVEPVPDQDGYEGQALSFVVAAADPDGDPLTYSLGNAPAGMSVDPSGIVTWTPGAGQTGVYRVAVQATDEARGDLAQTDEEGVTVTVGGPANQAPFLHADDQFVPEGSTLFYQLFSGDPDPGQTVTFSLVGPAPAGAALDPGGQLVWTPTEEQGRGLYTFRVRATDNGTPPLWREASFDVEVFEVNQPPEVEPIPDLDAKVGTELSYQVKASDPDRRPGPDPSASFSPLQYTLEGAPEGAAIDPQSGLLTWTPAPDQLGTHAFAVVVQDAQGDVTQEDVLVSVTQGASAARLLDLLRRVDKPGGIRKP